jgi:hypothetical protein
VSVNQDGHRSRPNPILKRSLTSSLSKIAAKPFVLKDFISKSFRIKDRYGNFLLTS